MEIRGEERALGRRWWAIVNVGGACLAALPVAQPAPLRADTFTVVEAMQAALMGEGEGYESAHAGDTANEPSRFRTWNQGRILLANANLRLELQPVSDISLEKIIHWPEGHDIHRFLKTAPHSQGTPAVPTQLLKLHRGTVFVQASERPVSMYAGNIRLDAKNAVFALGTTISRGQQVSVIKGQVKVRNADSSITFVSAGQTLLTGTDINPSLNPLDASPQSEALKQGLSAFGKNAWSFDLKDPATPPKIVGQQNQAHFEHYNQREAALLPAPNEKKIGSLDVVSDPPSSPH